MTVTKLPANDTRYQTKSVDYLSHLKSENGTGYTKIVPGDDKPVPIHLPTIDKNRWETGSGSRSNSNSDVSISKTISEPVSLSKPANDKSDMTTSLTAKLPSERLASIRSQLDPNNPIGKILEKSTVIQVENGDADYSERKRYNKSNSDSLKARELKNDIEKQVKTPKTSNIASYIQNSQPIATGTSSPKTILEYNNQINDVINRSESPIGKTKTSPIDSNILILENDVESPSSTGFENKTFEHENYLMKRGTDETDCKIQEERSEIITNGDDIGKMDTSIESTSSDLTEDSSPDTPSARRKAIEKDYEDMKSVCRFFFNAPHFFFQYWLFFFCSHTVWLVR